MKHTRIVSGRVVTCHHRIKQKKHTSCIHDALCDCSCRTEDSDILLSLDIVLDEVSRDWMKDAACRGMNVSSFYPSTEPGVNNYSSDSRMKLEAAAAVCRRCPVRDECLEYAAVTREKHGVWGGVSFMSFGRKRGPAYKKYINR